VQQLDLERDGVRTTVAASKIGWRVSCAPSNWRSIEDVGSTAEQNAHGEFGKGRVGVELKVDEEHVRRWIFVTSSKSKTQDARFKMQDATDSPSF